MLGTVLLVRQEAVCLSGQRAFWATGIGKHDGPGEGCLPVSTPLCLCVCACACMLCTRVPVCEGFEAGARRTVLRTQEPLQGFGRSSYMI